MWIVLSLLLTMNNAPADSFTAGKEKKPGYFDLYWDADAGTLYLGIDRFDEPFLFANWLARGLGSNDLGLDRGQLGNNRIVSFKRVGKMVYLIQPNLHYRANTDNVLEKKAVEESFAYSTLWGSEIVGEENGSVFVNLKSFIFRDEQGVVRNLKRNGEGAFRIDESRSRYVPEKTKSFPKNTEVEVALTFTGEPTGQYVPTVTPTSQSFTLHQRYSFIELPDDGYKPRRFHPSSGGFDMTYLDYAAPLDAQLEQKWVMRHRLTPKKTGAKSSEPVEPIVYYVDSGAPPLIRDALIEGASWWKEAFEAAGVKNGFRVEVMPDDMDPMDVRYNVIQWVHRSTRGWSYGASVRDPRTGEIIKGHVTLGSLRVRQDRLLFEGMLPVNEDGSYSDDPTRNPVQLALARIRQLAAHEVGHTLGANHNFAASAGGRASVMDYPAPLILLKDGDVDLSQVYDVGIGEWDKLMIRYLYGTFADEEKSLESLITEAKQKNLTFIDDWHGRSPMTMHPIAHVWDNGANGVDEFARVLEVRKHILAKFGTHNMDPSKFLSQLEDVLVPVYLHHRFQMVGCVKSIGGAWFDYGRNDGQSHYKPVNPAAQRKALDLILSTLDPEFLDLPPHLLNLIPPIASGYRSHREQFQHRTTPGFDDLAMAETAANMSLNILFIPQRLNRVYNQSSHDAHQLGVMEMVETILGKTVLAKEEAGRAGVIRRMVNNQVVSTLMASLKNTQLREDIRSQIFARTARLKDELAAKKTEDPAYKAHYLWLTQKLSGDKNAEDGFQPASPLQTPPGAPIGMGDPCVIPF